MLKEQWLEAIAKLPDQCEVISVTVYPGRDPYIVIKKVAETEYTSLYYEDNIWVDYTNYEPIEPKGIVQ